jgi:hypothetical protein
MMRAMPGVKRNRETRIEEPGLFETFVPMLANGRCTRTPQFRPLFLLTSENDRTAVVRWLEQHRPDLLPAIQRKR